MRSLYRVIKSGQTVLGEGRVPAYQMNGEKIRGYHTPEEWRAILLDQAEKTMAGLVCTPEGCGPASQPLD